MERIAVIDFETTGISPSSSCRATEIAVVILEQGRIVERYQSLMNAGVRELSHDLLRSLQKVPAAKINEHLKRHRGF